MKYEPERYQPKPGARPPVPLDQYFAQAAMVEKRNAHLPGKSWLYWGYFLIFCSIVTIPTGGVFLCAPAAAFLLWHYYSRRASYRTATEPIPYTPRSNA